MTQADAKAEFEVVFVCTGNVFRSAIAEAVLRERTGGLPVHVSSAGTLDLGGAPAHRAALELAPGLGLDLSAHRSRCVLGSDLSRTDLVVGFERSHIAAIVVDCGADRHRTFTLPEVVELLDQIDPPAEGHLAGRAREALCRADELREPGDDLPQVADPIGGPPSLFVDTADTVAALVSRLAEQLFPRSVPA